MDTGVTASVKMVRLVLLVVPLISIVVTLAGFRCPEGSMFRDVGGVRIADHLAAIVDAQSFAGPATGEGAEVGHHPVFKQKSMERHARCGRSADHLAAVVDAGSPAEGTTGEGAEVDHHPVFNQKRLPIPPRSPPFPYP